MNLAIERAYGLVGRGEAGLACDEEGVALGSVALVRAARGADGKRRCKVRSVDEVERVLRMAYGVQPAAVIQRSHRGLRRVAARIEAGDLALAGIEAVMLGLPKVAAEGMAKLVQLADLEKAGDAWEDQPRVPAGQTSGGQWTVDGGAGTPTAAGSRAERPVPTAGPRGALDDAVYRPDLGVPSVLPTGGAEESEEPPSSGDNRPPGDFTTLQEVFPGLKEAPGLAVPLAPVDGFLGVSARADAANADATLLVSPKLVSEIRAVDPKFVDDEILPPDGIAGLSWQGRANLLTSLRLERASVYYRFRGDAGPLQVETLQFLQGRVNRAYEKAARDYDVGRLKGRLSREEAIGNSIDTEVRQDLRELFNAYRIPYGPGQRTTINNRDYGSSGSNPAFRIPDARVGNAAFDWTLTPKTITAAQVRGFFRAQSAPAAVVIIRPSQLGSNNTYLIPRPAEMGPGS